MKKSTKLRVALSAINAQSTFTTASFGKDNSYQDYDISGPYLSVAYHI